MFPTTHSTGITVSGSVFTSDANPRDNLVYSAKLNSDKHFWLFLYLVFGSLTMEKKVFRYQKLMRPRSEHCCVPLCVVSARYNSTVSFHSFPVEEDLRKKWIVQIRRDDFQVNKNTKVCSVHFRPDDFMEGARLKRLKKGVFPTLFEWNHYQEQPPRLSVWERRERPLTPDPDSDVDQEDMDFDVERTGHDYCSVPEAAAVDMVLH